jgi:hypothetical protein
MATLICPQPRAMAPLTQRGSLFKWVAFPLLFMLTVFTTAVVSIDVVFHLSAR